MAMTLIVYPCGPHRGDLLRYSLRSLAAACDDERPEVVLIGDIPDYIDRTRLDAVPLAQQSDQFVNVWRAWEAAARYLDGREWWWWNDDFMVTAGVLDDVLVDAHRGPLETFCKALAARRDVGIWRRRAQAALDVLRGRGYDDPWCWEAHRPMRAVAPLVHEAAEACAAAGLTPDRVAVRTLIATLDERAGEHLPDPKVERRDDNAMPMPLASAGPQAWRGRLGYDIRATLPYPSPWERA